MILLKRGETMKKEIGFYDDRTTPYKYSYSPYAKMWYEDTSEQMPEPSVQAEELTDFKLYDELGNCIWWKGEWDYKDMEELQMCCKICKGHSPNC